SRPLTSLHCIARDLLSNRDLDRRSGFKREASLAYCLPCWINRVAPCIVLHLICERTRTWRHHVFRARGMLSPLARMLVDNKAPSVIEWIGFECTNPGQAERDTRDGTRLGGRRCRRGHDRLGNRATQRLDISLVGAIEDVLRPD